MTHDLIYYFLKAISLNIRQKSEVSVTFGLIFLRMYWQVKILCNFLGKLIFKPFNIRIYAPIYEQKK